MSMFSQAERERIAATIGEVEQRTAGEIVVAEFPASDGYADLRLAAAIVTGLAAAALVHLIWPWLWVGAVLAIECVVGLFAWSLSGVRSLLRLLVPRARSAHAVERAAQAAFLGYGVHRTRDRTGVLIFLCELEHRVVILGDEGIHARVQEAGWGKLVTELVAAIKTGHACDGVCAVVRQLGAQLEAAVPIKADDTNELANEVRRP